jgi:hypothetical protein
MNQSTAIRSSDTVEPALDDLLANVLRNAGWIMAGGSAQFIHGALSEMQSNLHLIHRHARDERVQQAVNILDEKATRVAANKASDAVSVLSLRRVLAEFEQAMKAYLGAARKR